MTPPVAIRGHRQLWQSVLLQAARDILRTASSKYGCDETDHRAALAWVGTRDFHQVCALAGMDGAAVAGQLQRMVRRVATGEFDPGRILRAHGGAAQHRSIAQLAHMGGAA
jgi:hypothetical protein